MSASELNLRRVNKRTIDQDRLMVLNSGVGLESEIESSFAGLVSGVSTAGLFTNPLPGSIEAAQLLFIVDKYGSVSVSVKGQSRSLKVVPFDRLGTVSY